MLHEREDGVPELRVTELASGESRRVALPEPVYEVHADDNPEFGAQRYRFVYESLTTPRALRRTTSAAAQLELLKRTRGAGRLRPRALPRASASTRARRTARASRSRWCARRDTAAGPRPLLLIGYGAYGYPLPTTFSYSRISLLDRGVIFAIAHVRGGGELGKRWHDQGRMQQQEEHLHRLHRRRRAPDRARATPRPIGSRSRAAAPAGC